MRLKYAAQLSHEKIARACQLSKGVVRRQTTPRTGNRSVALPQPHLQLRLRDLEQAGSQRN